MKGMRNVIFTAFYLVTAVLMAACGGGGGGGTTTPTNATNAVVNKGVIEKFGSIFVNGIEFKTAGAVVHLRDDSTDKNLGTEAEVQDFLKSGLKKGMVVTVKGFVDDAGTSGVAQEIEFRNTMKAKVDSIDLANSTITVLGQKISVTTLRSFPALLSATS